MTKICCRTWLSHTKLLHWSGLMSESQQETEYCDVISRKRYCYIYAAFMTGNFYVVCSSVNCTWQWPTRNAKLLRSLVKNLLSLLFGTLLPWFKTLLPQEINLVWSLRPDLCKINYLGKYSWIRQREQRNRPRH